MEFPVEMSVVIRTNDVESSVLVRTQMVCSVRLLEFQRVQQGHGLCARFWIDRLELVFNLPFGSCPRKLKAVFQKIDDRFLDLAMVKAFFRMSPTRHHN